MKKILLSFFAVLAFSNTAFADDELKVENVYVSTTAENTDFVVFFYQDVKSSVSGLDFSIQLPDGVEFVKKANGDPEYEMGTTFDSSPTLNIVNGILNVAMGSSNPIKGTKGTLIAFKIKPSGSLTGTTLTGGKIFNASESKNGKVNLSDFDFNITITDRVVLDENSPFETEITGSGINVLLKRSLKANTWSSIYLPFRVTYSKMKTAFGDDVQYAKFTGWSSEVPGNDICIDFKTATGNALISLTPYLINVSSTKSELLFNSVTFGEYTDPTNSDNNSTNPIKIYNTNIYNYDEDEEVYSYAKGTMTGVQNLHAMGANEMFLQDNTFYYSREGQNIKGFRATFEFVDPSGKIYLLPKLNNSAETRALFSIDGTSGNTTGFNSNQFVVAKTGKVYSMTGIYMGEMEDMNSLPKGVYIVDGKKVVKK